MMGSVTLERAVRLACTRNPEIESLETAVDAATARVLQAGFLSNPELEIEIEDMGLTGDERGVDAATYTVRLSQPIELGGKRAKRRRTASLETDLARLTVDRARLELSVEAKTRFTALLSAQERLRLVKASHELARKVAEAAAARVLSGKVPPLEGTKAEVELAGRRIELRRSERQLAGARAELGVLWGALPEQTVEMRAEGDIRELPRLPALSLLHGQLERNPRLISLDAQGKHAESVVEQEKAARMQDVAVTAAIAHENESGAKTVELAVSMPLPLFDRNAGNIAAAGSDLKAIGQRTHATRMALRTRLVNRWRNLQSAIEQANAIEREMLPGARGAFEAAAEQYRSGKIDYLEMVDAQRTLAETEMHWLDALSAAHQAAFDLERVVGGELPRQPGE